MKNILFTPSSTVVSPVMNASQELYSRNTPSIIISRVQGISPCLHLRLGFHFFVVFWNAFVDTIGHSFCVFVAEVMAQRLLS